MRITAQIPNAITSANLLCGCLAVVAISNGNFTQAAILVLTAAFFDFFDGLSARLLKVGSPMGAELDSLADVVSFGLVPAYLAFSLIENENLPYGLNYLPFLLAIFSAIRLAKFNVDTRQTNSFIGLPTPANALFWISIPLINWQNENQIGAINLSELGFFLEQANFILAASILLSYLLIAEMPLMALKFKHFGWTGNQYRWSLIIISLLLFGLIYFAAIPFILILYLIISAIDNANKKENEV